MDVEKTCKWCSKTFIAHSYKTKFCSKQYNGFAYKAAKKKERQQEYLNQLEIENREKLIVSFSEKEFLTPTEVGTLQGISRATVYRYMSQGDMSVFTSTYSLDLASFT